MAGMTKRSAHNIQLAGCALTSTGIKFAGKMTLDEWEGVGEFLERADAGIQWWIGDWLLYGEGKPEWGEGYEQATEMFDREYSTLTDYKYVAQAVEFSLRKENLSWNHHAHVAPLSTPDQKKWLERAEKKGWSAKELRNEIRSHQREQESTEREWPDGVFRVIYADPPWSYNDERTGTQASGGVVGQYSSMPTDDICKLDVPSICDSNSVLFLWATSPLLPDALQVMSAWGFVYKSSFVWDKQRGFNGHYNDVRHELLLIGVRGSCTPDIATLPPSVVAVKRGRHSVKPDDFRQLIDSLYVHGPRVELFARKVDAEGWQTWGDQA